jgi:hypothetical protein
MSREITVILKKPDSDKPNLGAKVWNILNEVIRSSLFSFFFGASLVTLLPLVQEAIKPKELREAQQREQEARSDASLVAPFIANLDVTQPDKSKAVIAALQELDRVSREADMKKESSPIFKATIAAITIVKEKSQPRVSTGEDTPPTSEESTQKPSSTPSFADIYQKLKDSVIYIQVTKNNSAQFGLGNKLLQALQSKSLIAPGIEEISRDKMPNNMQIRYFNDSDAAGAKLLAEIIYNTLGNNVSSVKIVRLGLKAKPGTLEVWFPRVNG